MTPRLATWLRVEAHQRRVELSGCNLVVERQGCREAGAIIVKCVKPGESFAAPAQAKAYAAVVLGNGQSGWTSIAADDWLSESQIDDRLAKATLRDPDLWIVTVEDREGRHFLEEEVVTF